MFFFDQTKTEQSQQEHADVGNEQTGGKKRNVSRIANGKNKVTLQIKCMFLLLKTQFVAPVESRLPLLSVAAATLRTVVASRP